MPPVKPPRNMEVVMKAISYLAFLFCLVVFLLPPAARADGKSQLAKEAAEFILQRFGKSRDFGARLTGAPSEPIGAEQELTMR